MYRPPQSARDVIDNQLSIDRSALAHSRVGVACLSVLSLPVHQAERKWASRWMSVPYSLVVQLHLYNSHFAFWHMLGKTTHKREKDTRHSVWPKIFNYACECSVSKCLHYISTSGYSPKTPRLRLSVVILGTLLYLSQIHCSISCTGVTRHDTNFCFKHKNQLKAS